MLTKPIFPSQSLICLRLKAQKWKRQNGKLKIQSKVYIVRNFIRHSAPYQSAKKGKKRILQIDFNIWINLSENKMHSQSKVFISLDPKSVFSSDENFLGSNFVVMHRFHLDLFKNETYFLASAEIQIYSIRMAKSEGADANRGTGKGSTQCQTAGKTRARL